MRQYERLEVRKRNRELETADVGKAGLARKAARCGPSRGAGESPPTGLSGHLGQARGASARSDKGSSSGQA